MEKVPLNSLLSRLEREAIYSGLVACAGSIKRTAVLLCMDRATLARRIDEYKIDVVPIREFWFAREQETIDESALVRDNPNHEKTQFGTRSLVKIKAEMIFNTLKNNDWNRAKTARDLKLCIRTIRNWIPTLKELGYTVPSNPRGSNGKNTSKMFSREEKKRA